MAAAAEVGRRMPRRRAIVVGTLIALFAAGAVTLWIGSRPSPQDSRVIADALLVFHHRWATNGYRSTGTIPEILQKPSRHEWSAGMYGAYVHYPHDIMGAKWGRMLWISRAQPNDTTWTLYDQRYLAVSHFHWRFWNQKLLTVTNNP